MPNEDKTVEILTKPNISLADELRAMIDSGDGLPIPDQPPVDEALDRIHKRVLATMQVDSVAEELEKNLKAASQCEVKIEESRKIAVDVSVNNWKITRDQHRIFIKTPFRIALSGPAPTSFYLTAETTPIQNTKVIHLTEMILEFNKDGLNFRVIGWTDKTGVPEVDDVLIGTPEGNECFTSICRFLESMRHNQDDYPVYLKLADLILETGKELIDGPHPDYLKSMSISSRLIHFSFKLIREIGSQAVLNDLILQPRYKLNFLCKHKNKSFKEIIKEEFGNAGPRILKYIGENLTIGAEIKEVKISEDVNDEQLQHILENDSTIKRARAEGRILKPYSQCTRTITMVGDKFINMGLLSCGELLKALLPVDKIQEVLDVWTHDKSVYSSGPLDIAINRVKDLEGIKWMKQRYLSDKAMVKLLTGDLTIGSVTDCAKLLQEFVDPASIPESLKGVYPEGIRPPKNWKTAKEFHDKISRDYTEIKTEASNKPIKYPAWIAKLHGIELDGVRAVLPFESKELVYWGQVMKICVASYADRAAAGEKFMVCFYEGNEPKYMLDFRPLEPEEDCPRFVEFRAYHNGEVPAEKALTMKKLMTSWYQESSKEMMNEKINQAIKGVNDSRGSSACAYGELLGGTE